MRDPDSPCAPPALLTTNPQRAPGHLLTDFVRRRHMEVPCEEARAHRGVATQRQWRHPAMARTTPALLALDARVPLIAAHLLGTNTRPVRTAAWYRQAAATFSDTMALGRCGLWRQEHCSRSRTTADGVPIPQSLFHRLTDALC